MLKKIGVSVMVLLAVLVSALALLQMLVNPNDYKQMLKERAAVQQIDLDIVGNIHWSLFPRPAIVAEDIKAVLPIGGKRQPLHIEKVSAALEISKLLHRQIGFSSIKVSNASTVLGAAGENQQRLEGINILVSDFMSDGRPFPAELSLNLVKNDMQLPVKLTAMIGFELLNQQIVHVLVDQVDLLLDSGRITGSVLWQQGSPSRTVFKLNSEKLPVRNLQFGNVLLSAVLEGEKLNLTVLQADAYQGQVKASGLLDVSGVKNAVWKMAIAAQGIQLSPLLADWSQKKPSLSKGVLQLDADVASLPNSKAGAVGSLSGEVKLALVAAALDGENLEKLACEAAAKLDNKNLPTKSWSAQTELREIRGVAQIKNGIAWFSPLHIKMDTLDIVGSGPVNLANSTLDIPLDMRMLAKTGAANACEILNPRLTEVAWPLRCKGNYAVQEGKDLCGVDQSLMSKLLLQAAEQKLRSRLDGDGGKLKDVFKGLLN